MATTKKKAPKKSKVISLTGESLSSDAARIAELRDRMTPTDRDNYDKTCKAIEISIDTQRLSVFPQLVSMKAEIERRYEQSDDDRVMVTWDDAALSEAAGA